ncbi:MAG: hypothetical protein ABI746_12950 [Dermatophilaceae bacterium]
MTVRAVLGDEASWLVDPVAHVAGEPRDETRVRFPVVVTSRSGIA